MKKEKPNSKILKILLKDFTISPTITFLSKEAGLSRVGMWKLLKKMQAEKLIILSKIGSGKTNAYTIRLNWNNSLLERTLALYLAEDALKNPRWLFNFAELEHKADFIILYGSIINSPKEANDIDILSVTSNKGRFIEIEEVILNIQKTQIKKIHSISLTPLEFKQELEKPNNAFIDAVKKGIILFGQEKFIKFINSVTKNEGKRS